MQFLEGEISVILGKNGEGKSTLINLIVGKHRADNGSISLCSPAGNRTDLHSLVGICPQSDIVFPYLTVRDQL